MRNALTRVDGMALPDCLGGHVVNILFRKVFKEELELRSIDMVERVRSYMQSILQKLFQTACREFPSLLNEVKTSLVEEFMDFKQEQTVEAVLNVVKAELGWLFTQHRDYTTTNTNVQDMVRKERLSEAACQATGKSRYHYPLDSTRAVGEVPKEFIKKMVGGEKEKDDNIRKIQVEYRRAFTKACLCQQTDSIDRCAVAFFSYIFRAKRVSN